MIQFPLADGAILAIIEPGNIARLKSGRPLRIGEHAICFTPDMPRFLKEIGLSLPEPAPNERISTSVSITPERIDAALRACRELPEVVR